MPAARVSLEACWDGSCRTVPVELRPATTVGPTSCSGHRPADVCSAQLRRLGGSSGFADLPELPERRVRVTLTVTGVQGQRLVHHTLELTPRAVYPNGPDCGAGGPQAHLVVGAKGHITRR
jgi:hypothetical protein